MRGKNSLVYSILKMLCPRCREGRMFPARTLYTTRFMRMHKTCPCCGQSFEPEPGFYLGVVYTSYILHAGLFFVILFAVYQLWPDLDLFLLGAIFLGAVLLLLPVTFRLSRAMWIYIFVRYEGPCNRISKR